jgi:hypothetical protein
MAAEELGAESIDPSPCRSHHSVPSKVADRWIQAQELVRPGDWMEHHVENHRLWCFGFAAPLAQLSAISINGQVGTAPTTLLTRTPRPGSDPS